MPTPAESYEVFAVPGFFAPWAERLIQVAEPLTGERVLDLGCGTGIVARRVAPLVGATGRISGIDRSADMIAVARAAAKRAGFEIDWHTGPAEELPFPDHGFDLVLCQFALMFFDDHHAALAELHRVLAPGGRVALSVFQGIDRHPLYRALHDAIDRRAGNSGIGDIFALGDADRLRSWLADAGFEGIEIESVTVTQRFPEPEQFLAGEIELDAAAVPAMQALDADARRALVDAIRDDMAEPLRAATDGSAVVVQFHAYLVHAVKPG